GLEHELRLVVSDAQTVPALYPEAPEFRAMPAVFASGFMVGMVEWACIRAIAAHLEPEELSLGTGFHLTHSAATPPGMAAVARPRLDRVDGPRLPFAVQVDDERDRICDGAHERFVVDRDRFLAGVDRKRAR